MHVILTDPGVEYGLAEEPEAEAMASLLADTFSRSEPMAAAVQLPHGEVLRLVNALAPKALSERLSIVARDTSTGQILGALLADDFGTPAPVGLADAAPGFAPVGALLDSLDDRYRASTTVTAGTHAHIFMVGVARDVSSRGIATRLVEVCMEQATRLGYVMAITEATGSASQHIFRKLGFRELLTVSYREFLFQGIRVFSSIEGVDGTRLMVRTLVEGSNSGGRSGPV